MKKVWIIMLLFVSVNILYAQSTDLSVRTTITPEYVNYLHGELAGCDQIIANPSSESAQMKAYAKRIFIDISLIQCKIDTTMKKDQTVFDSVDANNRRLEDFYNTNIATLNTASSKLFFSDLLELFKDPRYGQLRSDVEDMSANYQTAFEDLSSNSGEMLDDLITRLQQISDDFSMLRHNTAPFTLVLSMERHSGDELMTVTDAQFRTVDAVVDGFNETIRSLKHATQEFDSLQHGTVPPTAMINSLKAAIQHCTTGLDSLSYLLTTEPLSMFQIKTDWIADAKTHLADATDLLNGRTYMIGGDHMIIRPVAILEHSVNDWGTIVLDFYRTGNRYSYTFGNLFPNALPPLVVDKLHEDMVINGKDDEAAMRARMRDLKSGYLHAITTGNPTSSDYMGAAFAQTYLYMADLNIEMRNFVQFVQAGDFRNGFQFHVLNNTAVTDSISHFYNTACTDRDLLFVMLMITKTQAQPYTINPSTQYYPTFVPQAAALGIKDLSNGVAHEVREIGNSLETIYNKLDELCDMSLDPNLLDFSHAHSPYDFIVALEKSNPHFLDLTPKGIAKFQELRGTLRSGFSTYAENMGNLNALLDSLAIYRTEFNLNGSQIKSIVSGMNTTVQEVNTDFQQPDSTTTIDGKKVNLSAWFDAPPQHLLLSLKWYFDADSTTDNTLGGMFPGRADGVIDNNPSAPKAYALSQNYPNPFNPTTDIGYRMSDVGFVRLAVYDVLGQEVATLVNEVKAPGEYHVRWNAAGMTSGVYFYRLNATSASDPMKTFSQTCRMMLVK